MSAFLMHFFYLRVVRTKENGLAEHWKNRIEELTVYDPFDRGAKLLSKYQFSQLCMTHVTAFIRIYLYGCCIPIVVVILELCWKMFIAIALFIEKSSRDLLWLL